MKAKVKIESFRFTLKVTKSRKLLLEELCHNELSDWYINNET